MTYNVIHVLNLSTDMLQTAHSHSSYTQMIFCYI